MSSRYSWCVHFISAVIKFVAHTRRAVSRLDNQTAFSLFDRSDQKQENNDRCQGLPDAFRCNQCHRAESGFGLFY